MSIGGETKGPYVVHWYCPGTLITSERGLSLPVLFSSAAISVDEVLEYVVRWLTSVIFLNVAIKPHRIF